MRAKFILIVFALALLALTALTGDSLAIDPSAIQDTAAFPTPLREPIGQTFIAHYPRLRAIQVLWSIPAKFTSPRGGRVTLHLRASPASERDLATATIALDQIRNNEFSKFTFAPIPESENQTYYFYLETDANVLALWSSGQDSYTDGALFINDVPAPRDLAFRAYYEPDMGLLARALAKTLARFPIPIVFFALVVLLPLLFRERGGVRVAILLLSLLAIAVALLQIRDLPAPLWVDSLTHAHYVQFILTQGRLPTEDFYHLGFHVLVALAAKSLNLSIPQSLLLTGQFSWVFVGVAVSFLSRKISGSDIAGPVSAVCVWFLSPTPAYFITWGRYPLVLGSALLAFALLAAIKLFERRNALNIFVAALTFGMLAFTQIRLVAFYGAFVMAYALVPMQGARHATSQSPISNPQSPIFKQSLLLLISFSLPVALWLAYLFSGGVTPQSILALNQTAPSIDMQTAFEVIITHHGIEFLAFAAISSILGVARRSRVAFLMLGWVAALGALTLIPPIVGELVPLSLIVLMAFLPAAILIGDAARVAFEKSAATAPTQSQSVGVGAHSASGVPHRFIHATVWVALIAGVSILGAWDMVNIANPATILFTRADDRAMEWIKANTRRDEKFLVNSFNWVGTTFVPSDGGGWIPFFTSNPVEYLDAASAKGDSEVARRQWIAANRIKYIYLGMRTGTLSPAEFIAQPENFSMVYDREGIRILEVGSFQKVR